MIRDLNDLSKEVLEIHREENTSIAWRDDHVRKAVADYQEYQHELEAMDLDESNCSGCIL